jgi:hypothetical protein
MTCKRTYEALVTWAYCALDKGPRRWSATGYISVDDPTPMASSSYYSDSPSLLFYA